jgi:hypothetical protein
MAGAVRTTNRLKKLIEGVKNADALPPAEQKAVEPEVRRPRSRVNSTVASSEASSPRPDDDPVTVQQAARGQQGTQQSATDADGLEIAFKPKIQLFVPRLSQLSATQLRRKLVAEKYAAELAGTNEVARREKMEPPRPQHDLDIVAMFESQEKVFASTDMNDEVIDVAQVQASLDEALATFIPDVYLDDLLQRSGNDIAADEQLKKRANEIIRTIKILNHYRADIKSMYQFYTTSQLLNFEKCRESLSFAHFKRFARDAHCSASVMMALDRMFMTCNIERDDSGQRMRQDGPDQDGNTSKGMVLKEFVEGILRLACAQYPSSKLSLADRVSRFMANHVMMNCCKLKQDNFRKQMKEFAIDNLFKRFGDRLLRIFEWAARRDNAPGMSHDSIDLREFGLLMRHARVIDQIFTNVKVCHVFIQASPRLCK